MKPGLWQVGVAAVLVATSTALATGWLQHGSSSPGRLQATGDVPAGRSVREPLVAAQATTPASPSVGRPGTGGAFTLTVHTGRGQLEAAVAPLRASLRSDGTAKPIDPPHDTAQQWNTAAWIEQSSYPAIPAGGPSYVYGHACHYHVCPFTRLTEAAVGDTVAVRTASQALTYQVCALGVSPKAANLVVPTCGDSAADLVLVTCQYENADTSVDNLVVVATLISGSQPAR